jgi:hypothetical protein
MAEKNARPNKDWSGVTAYAAGSSQPGAALVWEGYDNIVKACVTAWNWLIADPARIISI